MLLTIIQLVGVLMFGALVLGAIKCIVETGSK